MQGNVDHTVLREIRAFTKLTLESFDVRNTLGTSSIKKIQFAPEALTFQIQSCQFFVKDRPLQCVT